MRNSILRLVHSASTIEEAPALNHHKTRVGGVAAPAQQQLQLPFMDEMVDRAIFLVAMDQIHGSRFIESISRIKPKTVLDLRSLVRFDLPGTSRGHVFNRLKYEQSNYIHDPIAWNTIDEKIFSKEYFNISHHLYHEVIERQESPLVLLTSKINEVIFLCSHINRLISSKSSSSWKIEHFV